MKARKSRVAVRSDIADYQYQFTLPDSVYVVNLADMTKEELQEALARSMDAIDALTRLHDKSAEIISAWGDGRIDEEEEEL